jgi:hypothetical protein
MVKVFYFPNKGEESKEGIREDFSWKEICSRKRKGKGPQPFNRKLFKDQFIQPKKAPAVDWLGNHVTHEAVLVKSNVGQS